MNTMTPDAAHEPEDDDLEEQIAVLESEIIDLESENEELRQAAELVSPYAMPSEVFAVLNHQLAGWPAARWRRLAELIEEDRP
jgi:hypothetical protein